jgi:hypothetical protein
MVLLPICLYCSRHALNLGESFVRFSTLAAGQQVEPCNQEPGRKPRAGDATAGTQTPLSLNRPSVPPEEIRGVCSSLNLDGNTTSFCFLPLRHAQHPCGAVPSRGPGPSLAKGGFTTVSNIGTCPACWRPTSKFEILGFYRFPRSRPIHSSSRKPRPLSGPLSTAREI